MSWRLKNQYFWNSVAPKRLALIKSGKLAPVQLLSGFHWKQISIVKIKLFINTAYTTRIMLSDIQLWNNEWISLNAREYNTASGNKTIIHFTFFTSDLLTKSTDLPWGPIRWGCRGACMGGTRWHLGSIECEIQVSKTYHWFSFNEVISPLIALSMTEGCRGVRAYSEPFPLVSGRFQCGSHSSPRHWQCSPKNGIDLHHHFIKAEIMMVA